MMSLTTILLLALCVVYTGACSCFIQNDPKGYCQEDLIIRGKVLSETLDNDEYVYLVQWDTVIKMPLGFTGVNPIEIRSSKWDSLCGIRLPLNVSYLLLAYVNMDDMEDGVFWTGLCSGNREWDDLGADVQQLLTKNFVSSVCALKSTEVPELPKTTSP